METYYGHVHTPTDAIILFEACRIGVLPRVQRRLSEKERASIRSGSVFVWDEREAGMRRWTDGKSWSASRVAGSFLTYREMEGKRLPSANGNGKGSSGEDSGGEGDSNVDGNPGTFRYKPDGLMKQSFSITTSMGQKLHLISYYARSHPSSSTLQQPSNDPALKGVRIPVGMYPDASLGETIALNAPSPPPGIYPAWNGHPHQAPYPHHPQPPLHMAGSPMHHMPPHPHHHPHAYSPYARPPPPPMQQEVPSAPTYVRRPTLNGGNGVNSPQQSFRGPPGAGDRPVMNSPQQPYQQAPPSQVHTPQAQHQRPSMPTPSPPGQPVQAHRHQQQQQQGPPSSASASANAYASRGRWPPSPPMAMSGPPPPPAPSSVPHGPVGDYGRARTPPRDERAFEPAPLEVSPRGVPPAQPQPQHQGHSSTPGRQHQHVQERGREEMDGRQERELPGIAGVAASAYESSNVVVGNGNGAPAMSTAPGTSGSAASSVATTTGGFSGVVESGQGPLGLPSLDIPVEKMRWTEDGRVLDVLRASLKL